jgi:hypothetical protein
MSDPLWVRIKYLTPTERAKFNRTYAKQLRGVLRKYLRQGRIV